MKASIAEAISAGAARLEGIADNPRREARLLLAHALGVTQNELIRHSARLVDTMAFDACLRRRMDHEPMALILGRREFWSMGFQVSSATLIPRPDSETLIEATLTAFTGREPPTMVLDLGTGTGCLLLSLLSAFPAAFGIGVDLVVEAAALAKSNAMRLGLIDRSAFIVGDWTNALEGRFDLIVANPPYVAGFDIGSLMPDVARYEPRLALDGGADGYDAYRAIIPRLKQHLTPDGMAILEVGQGQAKYVMELAQGAGFRVSNRVDLAQIPRAVVLDPQNR